MKHAKIYLHTMIIIDRRWTWYENIGKNVFKGFLCYKYVFQH